MSFKYINPGYHKDINIYSSSDSGQATPTTNQSRTGTAFYITDTRNYIKLPQALPYEDNGEVWAKFDLYLGNSDYYNVITFGTDYIYLDLDFNSSKIYYSYNNELDNVSTFGDSGLRFKDLNTIWIHFKIGSSGTGLFEAKINNVYLPKRQNITIPTISTSSRNKFILDTCNKANLISSVIISDEEISPNERVVLLPVSNTVTDMESLASGLYVADTASETLLQAVDTGALMQEYGSNTNVTGIVLIGNPAYQVDDVIGNITSIIKQNDTITDHEKIALSTSTDAIISSCFTMSTDTTIADLAGMQFGWRAEE